MLLDGAAMENLRRSHVAVIGLGGVGSYAAEALVRSGAGKITLCDFDRVSYTNLNRQLCALHSTLGMYKADVLAARALDINPEVRVRPLCLRYDKTTREAFFDGGYDYIVDAIDIVTGKIDLIEQSLERGIPIISSTGTGNRTNPALLCIGDISKTELDPLARVIRRELRARGILHHTVLWSTETPAVPLPLQAPATGRRSVPASVSWVPSCAGLMIAGYAIQALADKSS